jgi:hypothetical protein
MKYPIVKFMVSVHERMERWKDGRTRVKLNAPVALGQGHKKGRID